MTSVWTDVIPPGIKRDACERYPVNRLGGAPPLRFVAEVTENAEDTKVATVTLKFSEVAKDTYPKFAGGTAEEAVRHVKRVRAIELKLGFKVKWIELNKQKKEQQDFANSIDADTTDADELLQYESAKALIADLVESMKAAKKEYWSLWERLLDDSLHAKWHDIVTRECDTDGYVGTDGIRVLDKKRGRTFAGFAASVRRWLLLKMEPNAAERHQQYLD